MTRYFIAANIWLMFAVVTVLGSTNRTYDPHGPPMTSFFNGSAMESSSYRLIVMALFAVSAIFFVLTWMTRKKS
jgi:hypothetical protein